MKIEDVQKILQKEGFSPNLEGRGHLSFYARGDIFHIATEEGDDEYISIFKELRVHAGAQSHADLLEAANQAGCSIKCVKCMVRRDGEDVRVRVAVEGFMDSFGFRVQFGRTLEAVTSAVAAFYENLPDVGETASSELGMLRLDASAPMKAAQNI